ncbi:MAG: single-stranded DNA-binding protein [Patescibacteria group bacterium]
MDLNRATLIGRLTRDPELKSLPSGKSVATFAVATGRTWTDAQGQKQSQSEFHNIVMWGKLAEIAHQYLRKGKQVFVEGRLQTRDWTGQDGVKKYRTEIVADSMIMLGSPTGSTPASATSSADPGSAEARATAGKAASEAPKEVVEEEIRVEDIPF